MNNPNQGIVYDIKWAASDKADNLYLAGGRGSSFSGKSFVRKLSPEGNLEWETLLSTNRNYAMDSVVADGTGNVYATVRPDTNDRWQLNLVKLSPSGRVIWRLTEDTFSNPGVGQYPYHCILPGSHGEVYFLSARLQSDESIGLQLAKFNSGGRVLWRKRVPIARCYLALGGLARALQFTPDGDLVLGFGGLVSAEDNSERYGMVAKYGWDGRLHWLKNFAHVPFGSVAVSTNGNICAAGLSGFVVLNPQGKTLRDEGGAFSYHTVMGTSPDGVFSLRWGGGYHWIFLKPTGENYGRGFAGYETPANSIVPDGEGGWISIGKGTWELPPNNRVTYFTAFDSFGNQKWHHMITNLSFSASGNIEFSWLFMGSDKRLRVVAPMDDPALNHVSRGVGISAFALTTNRPPFQILSGPADVNWDGRSDVTFTITTAGEQAPAINWNQDPQPLGGFNRTLLIQSNDVPQMYGLIYARVAHETNYLYSRIAELRLNRLLWQTTPADSNGTGVFRLATDADTYYQIQQSTNLMDWSLRWPSIFNGTASFGINQDDGEKLFFRAVQVPKP